MKIAVGSSHASSNISTAGRSSFGIKANGKAFKILSSSLYNFKPLAIVREVSCNARDAHSMVGRLSEPFVVKLPTSADLHFTVRDFGPGLSDENLMGLYTTYFESTKAESNDDIGGFGLGSKSPLSYATSFKVNSYFDGVCRSYLAFQNDNGEPDIYRLTEVPSDEPTGLEVIVPVNENDIRKFNESAVRVFRFFATKPIVYRGNTIVDNDEFYGTPLEDLQTESIQYDDQYVARFYNSFNVSEVSSGNLWAKMGDVVYPISMEHVFDSEVKDERELVQFYQRSSYGKLVIDFRIGELDLNAGREGLSYDRATIARLKTVMSIVYNKLVQAVNAEIAKATHLDKAMGLCHHHTKFFGQLATEGAFTWRKHRLSNQQIRTLPLLRKHTSEFNEFNAMLVNLGGPYAKTRCSYLHRTYNGNTVRAINASNEDRSGINYASPITWVIVDESISGTKGSLRDRLSTIDPKHHVFAIRVTLDNGVSERTVFKELAENRDIIKRFIAQQSLFSDIRLLSELPSVASTNTIGTAGIATATRVEAQSYGVLVESEYTHLTHTTALFVQEFKPEATSVQYYLPGNKSYVKLGTSQLNMSRGQYNKRYRWDGSYAHDLLHRWAYWKREQTKVNFTLHYLTEAQIKEIAENPMWVSIEHQIVDDAVGVLSKLPSDWAFSINPAVTIYDRDVLKALTEYSLHFKQAVAQWAEYGKKYPQDRSSLPAFVHVLIHSCTNILNAQKERIENMTAIKASGKSYEDWSKQILDTKERCVHFMEYVGVVSPAINIIRQVNNSHATGWQQDIARLWDTSPNKISVADYITKQIQGT